MFRYKEFPLYPCHAKDHGDQNGCAWTHPDLDHLKKKKKSRLYSKSIGCLCDDQRPVETSWDHVYVCVRVCVGVCMCKAMLVYPQLIDIISEP